jgi:hypothetical protein
MAGEREVIHISTDNLCPFFSKINF